MKCVLSIALVVRTKSGYTIVYAFLENCKDYPGVAVNLIVRIHYRGVEIL